MALDFAHKEWLAFIIAILLLTDLANVLNIPFLRQILGFIFLTILPGILILQILKLNKIGSTEKFVLSVGLSIAFLMFFGLLINNLSLSLGYKSPLANIPLLILFNLAFIVLAIIGYKTNRNTVFSLPDLNLSPSEKAFLIVPIMFPALSISGMHLMNTTDDNLILMFLLFLIPIYIAFVCFFNHKFPKRLYPAVIFSIGLSLLLLMSLRSNHLMGFDVHTEYYLFQITLDNLHWCVFGHSLLDACLCISLLPTIYQSTLNTSPEFLYKVLYSLIYSVTPLVIYIISKKYIKESYAFLASCFFMFQSNFLWTAVNPRTNTAILFFALAMMILFSDKIDPLKKRILFIVFMASCMVSHYSTTYIFFFILLGTFMGIETLSKKYTLKKIVSLTIVILFFALIFFWYSQVTETAFNTGVGFIEDTLSNLNKFFVMESREEVPEMLGQDIVQKGISHKIQFLWTWLTFAFIAIGVITLIRRYKEMSFPELKLEKQDFLKNKFEVEYFVIALVCSGLLVAMVALPFVSENYGIKRLYSVAITILSIFFVIGGIILSKHFFFFKKRKPVLKEKNNCFFSKERFDGNNALEVRAYLIILLVLIPYFFCVTGVMYNIFGVPRAITLNSEGEQADLMYIHDQEGYGAKWLSRVKQQNTMIYPADCLGWGRLKSQGMFSRELASWCPLLERRNVKGYIYLRYYNVVDNKLQDKSHKVYDIKEYLDVFVGKSKIYDNGGSEIWK